MAITTISQLPSLNASLPKVGRSPISALLNAQNTTNSTINTGIVIRRNDLLEITLKNPEKNNGYSFFSSNISVSELHSNLFGKIQSINYYNNGNEIFPDELSPLSYNSSTYYKNGDRIFYLANQDAPLRVLKFIGSETLTTDHKAPRAENIADYVAKPKVTNVTDDSGDLKIETELDWQYDNELLSFNMIPLFAPMLSQNKLFNGYWLEASHKFNAYYSKVYAGLGKILQSLIQRRYMAAVSNSELVDYEISKNNKTYSSLAGKSDTAKKYYLSSSINNSKYESEYAYEYENLNIVIYNDDSFTNAVEWLKDIYENAGNTAASLNFWTVIYHNQNINSNFSTVLPNFSFIPPRVYNNTIIKLDDKSQYLYFYCGNEYTNTEDGIDMSEVLDVVNNSEYKLISTNKTIRIIRNDAKKETYIDIQNAAVNTNSSQQICIDTNSPLVNTNDGLLTLNIDTDVLTVKEINGKPTLTLSDNLSEAIAYTRQLIINSTN